MQFRFLNCFIIVYFDDFSARKVGEEFSKRYNHPMNPRKDCGVGMKEMFAKMPELQNTVLNDGTTMMIRLNQEWIQNARRNTLAVKGRSGAAGVSGSISAQTGTF